MSVDLDKIAKKRAEASRGNTDLYTLEEGDTLIYVCPPMERLEGVPFLELAMHNKTRNHGESNGFALCLDPEANPFVKDPYFLQLLKSMGRDVKDLDECVLDALSEDDEVPDKVRKEIQRKSSYLFDIVPLKYRKRAGKPWVDIAEGVVPLKCSFTIWDAICSAFAEIGDISDPRAAVLMRIHREGQKLNTRYTVDADPATVKEPMRLPKDLRLAVREATKDGGIGDLFKIAASMTQDTTRQRANWEGMRVDESDDDDDKGKGKSRKPDCFGDDFEDDDKKCRKCDYKKECAKLSAKPRPDDEDDDDDDEDDEEENSKAKKSKGSDKPKSKAKPEPDDDDDDEDEDEPKGKSKAKVKDDDDEDEDEDDEDEKPKAKSKSKKSKSDDDEDDDDDEDEDEEEKPKKKSKSKSDDDDDDDDPLADLDAKIEASMKKGKGKKG